MPEVLKDLPWDRIIAIAIALAILSPILYGAFRLVKAGSRGLPIAGWILVGTSLLSLAVVGFTPLDKPAVICTAIATLVTLFVAGILEPNTTDGNMTKRQQIMTAVGLGLAVASFAMLLYGTNFIPFGNDTLKATKASFWLQIGLGGFAIGVALAVLPYQFHDMETSSGRIAQDVTDSLKPALAAQVKVAVENALMDAGQQTGARDAECSHWLCKLARSRHPQERQAQGR